MLMKFGLMQELVVLLNYEAVLKINCILTQHSIKIKSVNEEVQTKQIPSNSISSKLMPLTQVKPTSHTAMDGDNEIESYHVYC